MRHRFEMTMAITVGGRARPPKARTRRRRTPRTATTTVERCCTCRRTTTRRGDGADGRSLPPNAPCSSAWARGERPPRPRPALTRRACGAGHRRRPGVAPLLPRHVFKRRARSRIERDVSRACRWRGHHGEHFRAALGAVKARRGAPPAGAASALTAPSVQPGFASA